MKGVVLRGKRRKSETRASSIATLKSRSVSLNSGTRNSASTWKRPRPRSPSRWSRWPMGDTAADTAREAWITGVGIVSSLGEGPQAHWQGLNAAPGPADAVTWAPFVIHPIAALELDKQIPKKGDQRQMEAWQRIGTYAAGAGPHSAGLKHNTGLLARIDMVDATGPRRGRA